MMDKMIVESGGRWSLNKILQGANKKLADLPTIPKYVVDGKNTLCCRRVSGQCAWKGCHNKGGHEVQDLIVDDAFVDRICDMLELGVQWAYGQIGGEQGGRQQGGHPGKHKGAPR